MFGKCNNNVAGHFHMSQIKDVGSRIKDVNYSQNNRPNFFTSQDNEAKTKCLRRELNTMIAAVKNNKYNHNPKKATILSGLNSTLMCLEKHFGSTNNTPVSHGKTYEERAQRNKDYAVGGMKW